MVVPPPERLIDEQREVEAQIREAFRGVSRAGGISWSESVVIDSLGSERERAAAREADREASWEELVDDPAWIEEPALGGFNFLDSVGYAYYVAPAMIRCARRGWGEFVCQALTISGEYSHDLARLITPKQAAAIARFLRFMIAWHNARGDTIGGENWRHAYKVHWRAMDPGNPRQASRPDAPR